MDGWTRQDAFDIISRYTLLQLHTDLVLARWAECVLTPATRSWMAEGWLRRIRDDQRISFIEAIVRDTTVEPTLGGVIPYYGVIPAMYRQVKDFRDAAAHWTLDETIGQFSKFELHGKPDRQIIRKNYSASDLEWVRHLADEARNRLSDLMLRNGWAKWSGPNEPTPSWRAHGDWDEDIYRQRLGDKYLD